MKQTAQNEYKPVHDWEEQLIHRELCKKLKLDHTNKWYMHKPESVVDNETNKILWDFEILTDYLISTRRLDQVLINCWREDDLHMWKSKLV